MIEREDEGLLDSDFLHNIIERLSKRDLSRSSGRRLGKNLPKERHFWLEKCIGGFLVDVDFLTLKFAESLDAPSNIFGLKMLDWERKVGLPETIFEILRTKIS